MARVTIDITAPVIFKTIVTVRITDINYGGHLGNDKVLSIMHEARMAFLNSMHYSEMDVEGVGLIMADAAIKFISEAFYNEPLLVEISIENISKVSFEMLYRLRCNQRMVALGKTGMVFFNYQTRKVSVCPEAFVSKIKLLQV
ncbi:MAG: thioesterase family protein [Bacteroidia bacterium]|nr:thioesterase family protein [Bacteroidia bacterium]